MAPLRFGILGTGNIARQFAEGVARSVRSRVTAVASRSAQKAADFASVQGVARGLGDYADLLRDDTVDAVYNALPNSLHHEWTVAALRAGKHVLCEKPLAATAPQAREMFAVARQTGRVLIEAFMYRAHPQTRRVLEVIRGGELGPIKLIRTSFCFRVRNTAGNIRFSSDLAGGALMDVGCYCINFSGLVAGAAPLAAHAVCRLHPSGIDEQTTAVMKYPGDITAEFTCGMGVQSDNTAYVCGEEGYLTIGWPWKPAPPGTSFTLAGGIPPRQDNPAAKPVAPAPLEIVVPNAVPLYGLEADAFAACVAGEAEPFVTEQESIRNMETLDTLRRQTGIAGV